MPTGNHREDIKYDDKGALAASLIMFETQERAFGFGCDVANALLDGVEEECMESSIKCAIQSSAAGLLRSQSKASQSSSPNRSSVSSALNPGVVTKDDLLYQSLESRQFCNM